MKKILVVFHDPDSRSGATASMLSILDSMSRDSNLSIDALIPQKDGDLKDRIEELGLRCYTSKYYTSRYACDINVFGLLFRYIKTVAKIFLSLYSAIKFSIKSDNYDLVYSNTSDIYIGAIFSRIIKAKHIWHIREFGLEDQNCRHICSDKLFYNFASNCSSAIIVISKSLYGKVSKYADKEKIHIIYNDIMGVSFGYKNKENGGAHHSGDNLKLLIVGQISPGKGQLDVIKALFELKSQGINFHLGIAGHADSKYADFLKKEVKEKQLEEHVEFLGYKKDMATVRDAYDIGIVASASEAFGRVTIEGMLAGLVMVGSNSGANPELIDNGKNGFLYEAGDYLDLAKVLRFISENNEDMVDVKENAYTFAKKFTEGRAGGEIKKLIFHELEQHNV